MAIFDNVKNFSVSYLANSIDEDDTSLTLESGGGSLFPDPPFNVVIWNSNSYNEPHLDPNVEIVRVTAKNGDTFTIERAQEGTTAHSHSAGDRVELNLTAKMIEDLQNAINQISEPTETETTKVYVYMSQDEYIHYSYGEKIIYFDSKKFDTLNEFDTQNYKFTASSDGYYLINASINVFYSTEPNVICSFNVKLKKNNTTIHNIVSSHADSYSYNMNLPITMNLIIYLNKDDYLQLYIEPSRAGYVDADYTYLCISKLNPDIIVNITQGGGGGGTIENTSIIWISLLGGL